MPQVPVNSPLQDTNRTTTNRFQPANRRLVSTTAGKNPNNGWTPSPRTAHCLLRLGAPPNQFVSVRHGKSPSSTSSAASAIILLVIPRSRYDAGSGGGGAFGASLSSSSCCTRSDGALQNRDAGYTAEPHWGCSRTLQLPAFITCIETYKQQHQQHQQREGGLRGQASCHEKTAWNCLFTENREKRKKAAGDGEKGVPL